MMNLVTELDELKSLKRKTKFSYNFLRNVYIEKLSKSSPENKIIYFEAISALDDMLDLYISLKTKMRERSVSNQIYFVNNWIEYIACIESITALRTNDKYLLRDSKLDKNYAYKRAISLWTNYKTLSTQKYS